MIPLKLNALSQLFLPQAIMFTPRRRCRIIEVRRIATKVGAFSDIFGPVVRI
jgi:hypothetical protein